MTTIIYKPIGIIHSPYTDPAGMPIQAAAAQGVAGTVEVHPEFCAGLKDLDGFSHIILLYHFHRSQGYALEVKPFMDDAPRGLFATRAPRRPNPIGLSIVRLVRVEGCTLHVEDVDILDGTPLLDIKPYVPAFDNRGAERIGWLSTKVAGMHRKKSDHRFT